jgi:ABC-type sugar transport system substrate-binding protein
VAIHNSARTRRLRQAGAVLATAAAALSVAACGSDSASSGSSDGAASKASGSGSKEIVIFLPPTSDPYAAHWLEAQKEEASKNGYKVRAIQTASASEAAAQVQQSLGGDKPAAFVWWPIQAKAQVASLAALFRSGVPVFQGNQLPVPGSEKYITAFIGVSDTLNGESSGKGAIAARDALKKSGATLHSAGGNVVVVALPAGYGATTDRLAGFKKAIAGSGLKILEVGNSAGFSAQDGFTTAAQVIAANKSKGIDIVYTQMDDYANGTVRALEQAGYKPGKDVMVIGGSCHGDESNVENKKIYSTSIQGAAMEGEFTMKTVLQYIKNPKVNDDTYVAPNTADEAPPLPETISKMNIISTPMVTADDYPTAKLWGKTAQDLCTF